MTPYRERRLALPPQCTDGLLQPDAADEAGGDVEQPQARRGERGGDQLGQEVVAEPVAGETQLGEAGLELQGAEERAEGRRGETQTGRRHGRAPALHLAQPGHVFVLLYERGIRVQTSKPEN